MTKLFLKTLSQFYYEKMVGSVPRDFTMMVSMGIQLEEGVREGRIIREIAPTNGARKFGNGFSRKKEQEVGMVAHGGPHQNHPAYQHTAPITPVTNITQQSSYQQQYPQQNYPAYQHIAAITPTTKPLTNQVISHNSNNIHINNNHINNSHINNAHISSSLDRRPPDHRLNQSP